jgi:hypothetical protein
MIDRGSAWVTILFSLLSLDARVDVSRILSDSITAAREWRCPFILYWQVYCNEAVHHPVKSNSDVRGFWLLRPDGTKAIAWPILENALRP